MGEANHVLGERIQKQLNIQAQELQKKKKFDNESNIDYTLSTKSNSGFFPGP